MSDKYKPIRVTPQAPVVLPRYSGGRALFKEYEHSKFWAKALPLIGTNMSVFPDRSVVLLEKNCPVEGQAGHAVCIVDPLDESAFHIFSAKYDGVDNYPSKAQHLKVDHHTGHFEEAALGILTETECGTLNAATRVYASDSVNKRFWLPVHRCHHPGMNGALLFKGHPVPIRLDAKMIFDGICPMLSEAKTLLRQLVTISPDGLVVMSAYNREDGTYFDPLTSGCFPKGLATVASLPEELLHYTLPPTIIAINRLIQPDLI